MFFILEYSSPGRCSVSQVQSEESSPPRQESGEPSESESQCRGRRRGEEEDVGDSDLDQPIRT